MDDALKAVITAVRYNEGLQINRKCQVILSKLQAAGLLWEQKVKPVQVLVHPSNRSGAMLNSFDMHARGAMVLTMGCLVDKLSDSLAVEIKTTYKLRGGSLAKQSGLSKLAGKGAPCKWRL